MRWQVEFWLNHRPVKTSHAETRPRHTTSQTLKTVKPGASPGVEFEVKNFQIYGGLRRAHTEVKNTLPTAQTIQTEKTLLSFEEQKKRCPYDVDYSDLYRCLSASVVTSKLSRKATATSGQKEVPSTAPAAHSEPSREPLTNKRES